MQVQIKFTRVGSSQVFGNFGPGDLLRCSAAVARHFVNEVACAVYVQGQVPAAEVEHPKPETPRTRKPKKEQQP